MPRRPRGFTLTELLVVILIVVVLAAVAFFATQSLRGKGNAAKSASNLRQLFTGHQLYLAEYGHFPSGNDWTSKIRAEAEAQCKSWHERVAPYVGLGSSLEDTQKLFVKDQLPPGVFEVPGRKRLELADQVAGMDDPRSGNEAAGVGQQRKVQRGRQDVRKGDGDLHPLGEAADPAVGLDLPGVDPEVSAGGLQGLLGVLRRGPPLPPHQGIQEGPAVAGSEGGGLFKREPDRVGHGEPPPRHRGAV